MKMLKCIVVDDDAVSRRVLERMLERIPDLLVEKVFDDALKAHAYLTANVVDLVFLDVEMPELSGPDVVKSLKQKPEIIFITAKENYALEAFNLGASDYLVKPVSMERLMTAIGRAKQKINSSESDSSAFADSIFVKANHQIVKLKLDEILYIEAYGDYVSIQTEKDRYIVHGTMKGIECKLPPAQFARVHRSHIVGLNRINAIEDTLITIGKKHIPIGETYKNDLMRRLPML